MIRAIAGGLCVLLLTAACRDASRERSAAPGRDETSAEPAGHAGEHGERELRIAPEMLRDLRVTTAPAEARSSGEGVMALGELRVDERAYAEVGTPHAARVIEVVAVLGERVEKGQVLVDLASPELGKARADYLRARSRAELARRTLERKRGLAAERIAPQRELEEAESDAAAAASEQAAAAAALGAFGIAEGDAGAADRAGFALRAPIAGTVIDRQALPGQMAEPARPLFRIADLARLWLVVHAFERDAVRVPVGATARASFPAFPGRSFAGRVLLIGQEVEASSRTLAVRIEVANQDGVLRPGMSASAWLPVGEAGAPLVAVPAAALQRMRDGWCVFLPRGVGAFEIRPVGRGRDLGGEVEVIEGLAAGEVVVVDGAFLLKAEAERAGGEGGHHDHD